ncbi:unnamed protein product [Rhizophagus irregularis]|nr:unnamed protein product [Rhizophagus irregularis]
MTSNLIQKPMITFWLCNMQAGELRQYLQDNFVEIDWYQLLEITKELKAIHDHGYVQRDFHDGNKKL